MKPATIHTAAKLFLVVILVLFSVGYTTVLSYCSMSDSSECCCGANHRDGETGDIGGVFVRADVVACNTVEIVGGLNDTKATVSSENSSKPTPTDESICVPAVLPTRSLERSLVHANLLDFAPPGIEIYLRTNTLLI